MKNRLLIAGGLSIALVGSGLSQLTHAQTFPPAPAKCVYLKEISTRRAFIRKQITSRSTNANTDFAVPTGIAFSNYIGRFIPENNARYTAEVNLKYNDQTSSTAVSRTVNARRFYLYNQPFRTPTNQQPFQINVRVSGDRNTAYQVAVLACQ